MATVLELLERINRGEDERTELKTVFDNAEQIARTVVAFANQPDGGWLIVGVNEDGSIGGVSDPEQVEQHMRAVCRDGCVPGLEPRMEAVQTVDGTVLVVEIEGRHPPYSTSDRRFWVRRGASTILIELDELIELMLGRPRETVSHQIVRLRASYFRSLYDVDIPLKPLNVFIGPNGSGKSNVFHLLRFLQQASSIPQVGQRYRDTFEELVWLGADERGERPDVFQVQLLLALPEEIERVPLRYTLQVAPDASFGLRFVEESLLPLVLDSPDIPRSYIDRRGRRSRVHTRSESDRGPGEQIVHRLDEDYLGLQYLGPLTNSPVVKTVQRYLAGWRLFDVDVQKARQGGWPADKPPSRVPALHKDGANLSEFLYAVQSLQHDDWHEIEWHLEAIDFVRELKVISVPGMSGQEVKYRLLERAFTEPLSAESISDGTIRFLAYLALLLGDRSASLICLEEPDRGIHPALMKRLASVLRYVATSDDPEHSPQVLLTTHDPGLLNCFHRDLGEDYFQVVVTEKSPETGKTVFRALDPDSLSHWLETFRLGELHQKGILDDYGRRDRG